MHVRKLNLKLKQEPHVTRLKLQSESKPTMNREKWMILGQKMEESTLYRMIQLLFGYVNMDARYMLTKVTFWTICFLIIKSGLTLIEECKPVSVRSCHNVPHQVQTVTESKSLWWIGSCRVSTIKHHSFFFSFRASLLCSAVLDYFFSWLILIPRVWISKQQHDRVTFI